MGIAERLESAYNTARKRVHATGNLLRNNPNFPLSLIPIDLAVVSALTSVGLPVEIPLAVLPAFNGSSANASSNVLNSSSTTHAAVSHEGSSILPEWAVELADARVDYLVLALLRTAILLLHCQTDRLHGYEPVDMEEFERRSRENRKKLPRDVLNRRRRQLYRVNESWRVRLPYILWLANYLYSLGKLLVLSERTAAVGRLDTWLLTGWNLALASIVYAVWKWYPRAKRRRTSEEFEKIAERVGDVSDSDSSDEDSESSEEEEAVDSDEEEMDLGSHFVNDIKLLLHYVLPFWKSSVLAGCFTFLSSWGEWGF